MHVPSWRVSVKRLEAVQAGRQESQVCLQASAPALVGITGKVGHAPLREGFLARGATRQGSP